MPFPSTFVWGAASSSYQVEGGFAADGKGASTWDQYSHEPGNIYMNHTGDVSCDHYGRMKEDVALMKQIGLKAYRFSISWPRIVPSPGVVNEAGIRFYESLVDELLGAGIAPWATLFHWDLPLWAYHKGGFLNRDIAAWFREYATIITKRLSDRVTHWMTINEPHIFLGPSINEGLQTSNAKKSHTERLLAAHNALLCHGDGAAAIREHAKRTPQVGWAPIGRVKVPATQSPEDVAAAKAATYGVYAKDFWNNAWLGDPVVFGRYPEDGLKLYHDDLANAGDGGITKAALANTADLKRINQPLDFYGINVYDAERIKAGPDGTPVKIDFPPGHAQNALRWFIEPDSLYYGPLWLYQHYKVPIVITENGMTNLDWVGLDGRVQDPQRIDYTKRYLLALERAIGDGADVRGYLHWSIMDNFEWQCGYRERFGLIHVDYGTLKRTLKDSAHWYKDVIRTNGGSLKA